VSAVRWLGFAVGVALLLTTASSVVKTLLIPRASRSVFGSALGWLVRGLFRKITARVEDLRQRERILAVVGPAWLISLLATWLVCLLLGFALVLWPLKQGGYPAALEEAGSSIFTLGFIRPSGPAPSAIVFIAGASGLILVALMIAYLPVLYAAFNRRETQVTTLEALAGAPAWGPELLARQVLIGDVAYLPSVYARWTEWAADISESHTNYRALIYFRSPDPQASWLLGLLAVLDAAALHLSFNPSSAPAEARPLLRVGYLAMRKLARGVGIAVSEDPHPEDPIVLTRQEFDDAVEHMRQAGWEFERSADEAWPQFHGWRVNYEGAAYAMARFLDVPPAVWSGTRPQHRASPQRPVRPPHREPGEAEDRPGQAGDRPGQAGDRLALPRTGPVRRGRAGRARPPRSRGRPAPWHSSTGGAARSRTRSSRPAAVRRCRNPRSRAGCRW
jgi:hypothetical protein